MGKGDKKSKKGKIWLGTYGNSRKRKKHPSYKATAPKEEKVIMAEVDVAKVKPKAKPAKKAPAKPRKKAAPKKKKKE